MTKFRKSGRNALRSQALLTKSRCLPESHVFASVYRTGSINTNNSQEPIAKNYYLRTASGPVIKNANQLGHWVSRGGTIFPRISETQYCEQVFGPCFPTEWTRVAIVKEAKRHMSTTPVVIILLRKIVAASNFCKHIALICFTPTSDQCQISPAASPEILHHTVWRPWLCHRDKNTGNRNPKFTVRTDCGHIWIPDYSTLKSSI